MVHAESHENKDGDIQKVTKYGVWDLEKLTREKKMAHPGSYIANGDGTYKLLKKKETDYPAISSL